MRLKKIKIGAKLYPVICDLNVLERIQEEFDTIQQFERELLGLYLVKDDKGDQVYNADGTVKMEIKEPSIKAIKLALISMIDEGQKYQAFTSGKEYEAVSEMDIMAECTIRYSELAAFLHDVYAESMKTKKV